MEFTVVGSSGSVSGPDSPASCYLVQRPTRAAPSRWSSILAPAPSALYTGISILPEWTLSD